MDFFYIIIGFLKYCIKIVFILIVIFATPLKFVPKGSFTLASPCQTCMTATEVRYFNTYVTWKIESSYFITNVTSQGI